MNTLQTLADVTITWPALDDLVKVLTLREYNTRLVVLSTTILGSAAGLVGSFLLLRKRSLMGDALSHATLPGICIAFIVMVLLGGSGKALPGLLAGAAATGLLGVGCVMAIHHWTRLKDDTAMGIVLSVFFGLGIALMGLIQNMPQGSAAGLNHFIYGKTASMIFSDFLLISAAAAVAVIVSLMLYKELTLLCFDEQYAAAQGWPVTGLDMLMLALVTVVTVIGLQSVGLILIIALLIIPPAAARFWTDRLSHMLLGAALIGGASGWLGSSLSALMDKLPAGAVIVLAGTAVFILSMLFGPARGVVPRLLRHLDLIHRVNRQHLLRAMYEMLEPDLGPTAPEAYADRPVDLGRLMKARSWSRNELMRSLRSAQRKELVRPTAQGAHVYALTPTGARRAANVVRNHRLWEMYLIHYADIAPNHVDRDADQIEHVLGADMVAGLEKLLARDGRVRDMPGSPHAIGGEGG